MSTAGAASSPVASPDEADSVADDERIVVVYDCTRLGLTASPPGFSFRDFFRIGRRNSR